MSCSPYQQASSLLNDIWNRHVSLKTLVYDKNDGTLTCSKSTYAIVANVLVHQQNLTALLEQTPVEGVKNRGLLYVLLYELLLGPHPKIQGGGALKRKLLKLEPKLRSSMRKLKIESTVVVRTTTNGGDDNGHEHITGGSWSASYCFPRYVRVNTLRASTQQVVEFLKTKTTSLDANNIYRDGHVPDLLVLPPDAAKHVLEQDFLSDKIVLQDKSSCFPALCMVHGFDDDTVENECMDYLDACAAPGNKTTHLVALIAASASTAAASSSKKNKTCRIFALDRSPTRLALLQKRIDQLVPTSSSSSSSSSKSGTTTTKTTTTVQVLPQLQDFLATKPSEYDTVTSILLDPSCSGSGIYTSLDGRQNQPKNDNSDNNDDDESENQQGRLISLSSFQCRALQHAMSFPSVQRIVYSTCSVHVEENEHVVARALLYWHKQHQKQRDDDDDDDDDNDVEWEIVAPKCMAAWPRRGKETDELSADQASCLIRADKEDETNGFFVCCLQRRRKNGKTKKKQPLSQPKKQPLMAELEDIPVYNGQFASAKHAAIVVAAATTNKDVITDDSKKRKVVATNDDSKDDAASNATATAAGTNHNKDDKNQQSKKRQKKNEWKRRQMKSKRERQAQRKEKAS